MAFDLQAYLRDLEYLVNIDSNSKVPEGTKLIADFYAKRYQALGWKVEYHHISDEVGPCLTACNLEAETYDILLLGHIDTALPIGAPKLHPFSIDEQGLAHGPGCGDMKSGGLNCFYAIKELTEEKLLDEVAICVCLNSDEEISSIHSRPLLEKLALKTRYAIALEPARKNGELVYGRRGVGRYTLTATGIAAHSGVNPQDGSSAINELACWIVELHKMNNPAEGTNVNIGKISGGAGANTVAGDAVGYMDIRFTNMEEVLKIEAWMRDKEQHPFTPGGARIKVSGGVTRPPMNPTAETFALCDELSAIGKKIGVDFSWIETGGAGDGSFTAMHGVPTIDGLGPIAGNTHSEREYMVVDSIEPRCRLLKAFVQHIAKRPRNKN